MTTHQYPKEKRKSRKIYHSVAYLDRRQIASFLRLQGEALMEASLTGIRRLPHFPG